MGTIARQPAAELKKLVKNSGGVVDMITNLFDDGTFMEIGAFAKGTGGSNSYYETVVTGYGAVEERLVYTFIEDGQRDKGAFGMAAAKKICSVFEYAQKNGAPVIGVFDSAGMRIPEGIDALAASGAVIKKVHQSDGLIPRIAIINGVCSGAAAVIASMFDVIIAVKDRCSFYINPPFLTKDQSAGSAQAAAAMGQADIVAENAADAVAKAKELLSFLPSSCYQGCPKSEGMDSANRLTGELESVLANSSYDVKTVIASIADNAKFLELGALFAGELVCGFIHVNGNTVGVVANNPVVKQGTLTPFAARKAAKFVNLCDSFGIRLLTLVDTCGYDGTLDSEKLPYTEALGELAVAYAGSENPKVTVITGRAYGSAGVIMGSKSIGADAVFALDSAKISIMPPESAVHFLYADKIKAAADPVQERAALTEDWNNTAAAPIEAARNGDIDDIIECAELRRMIVSSFEVLAFRL